MKIGAIVPNAGPVPLRLGIAEMGRAAEDAGVHSLWVSDHLVLGDEAQSDYPYSRDGRMTWAADIDYLECLAVCSHLAAVTSRCTIGSAILILPQRNVLQVAKEAATIDRLSSGRLVLGLGAGWNRLEMEALGYDFSTRGGRFDEMIAALRNAWSGRTSHFRGEHIEIPADLFLRPTPFRPDGPPLLVGGMSGAAIRRAARLADGWMGLAFVDQWDGDRVREAAVRMTRQSEANERPARWVLKLHCPPHRTRELPARIEEAAALGFEEFAVEVPWALGLDEGAAVAEELVRRFG